MKKIFMTIAMAAALMLPAAAAYAETAAGKRAAIQQMKDETLSQLYSLHPDAQREIAGAVGYAVFDSGSLAVLWVSGGYGHGVAHNNTTGDAFYMEMATAGVGLGLGAKNYNTIFVFHDANAFHDFTTTGLDLSAHADAAAKVGDKGAAATGAADILPGVRVYQITDNGLMAQAMVQGTKYWLDDELNIQNDVNYTVTPRSN
jgi:lipid-binding SYLF domain-containing protein